MQNHKRVEENSTSINLNEYLQKIPQIYCLMFVNSSRVQWALEYIRIKKKYVEQIKHELKNLSTLARIH